MFGRPKIKVIKSKLRIPSLGVKQPPSIGLVGALYTVFGTCLGVPVTYAPVPGVEVRVHTAVTNDPRITNVKSYLFIGDTTVFRERAGTYEIVMPPSQSSTDSITKALGRVMINAVRWERIVFLVAQFPSTGAIHALFSKDNLRRLKRPWGRPNPAGVPPPDTVVGLSEGVKYGDSVTVHDSVIDHGLLEEYPTYELGYVIYDDDIVTVTYVANPNRVSMAYRRVSEFGVKPLRDILNSIGKEGKEKSEVTAVTDEGKKKKGKNKKRKFLSFLRR